MLKLFSNQKREKIVKGPFTFLTSRLKYDQYVLDEIWDQDVYGLEVLPQKLVGAIIDVGAHIGGFSGRARQKWTDNPIYALEPHPINAQLFKKNARHNQWQKVHFFAKAITRQTQMINLYVDPENPAGHTLLGQKDYKPLPVKGITLAELTKEQQIHQIGVLKLDCEGSEYDILTHISLDLLKKIEFLLVEWHPAPPSIQPLIEKRLKKAGFRIIRNQADPHIQNQQLTIYERSE